MNKLFYAITVLILKYLMSEAAAYTTGHNYYLNISEISHIFSFI